VTAEWTVNLGEPGDPGCAVHQSRRAHDVLRMSTGYLQVDATVGAQLGRRRIGGHTQACP
jgi:hypothetical protein